MLIHYSVHPKTLSLEILKPFIKSCHWTYLKKYNLAGHHNAGWGFAYISIDSRKLKIKRTLHPIYQCKWEDLTKIKTRFLLIHARKTLFGDKRLENVHPIDIEGQYILVHNGTIQMKSFPPLNDNRLQAIQENTDLDTRRYLCTILDNLKHQGNLKEAIETTLESIHVNSAANAFLFNLHECHIIKYQNSGYNARHTTLFIEKSSDELLISTTPLTPNALEIPNKSLISIPELLNEKISLEFNQLIV
jgi:predicted glutamine amidotransferase